MSSISSINSDVSFVSANYAAARRSATAAEAVEAPLAGTRVDSVELSGAEPPYARLPEPRFDAEKVARVKQALQDGSYLSPDKQDAAIDRLLRDLDLL
jgi:anti-sigma28 factor (negative regulator of flagellin synthesis)